MRIENGSSQLLTDSPDPLAVLEAARPELVQDAGGGGAAEVLDHELEAVDDAGEAAVAVASAAGTAGEVLQSVQQSHFRSRLRFRILFAN